MLGIEAFYEAVAIDRPDLSLKYMAHIALMVMETEAPASVKKEILNARVYGDQGALTIAKERDAHLRAKFKAISQPYFEHHTMIGNRLSHGNLRAVMDLIFDEKSRAQRPDLWEERDMYLS